MSGRVCFLERSGDVLSGARLVGIQTDEFWRARPLDEGDSVLREAKTLAAWIAERARDRTVGFLCVDVDGSNCRWLTSPGADPVVLAAAMQNGDAASGDWSGADPAENSIQALSAPPRSQRGKGAVGEELDSGHRLAVLSVPDAMARITIDALDAKGVEVRRAGSLWHAMALAWDPGSPLLETRPRVEGAITSESPVTAVVLIDPTGRVIWSWSRSGKLLAGGAIMTPLSPEGEVRIGKPEIGRLISDWLAWSVQLGVTPVRTICVTPSLSGSELGEGALGAAIGRSWAGTTVDLAVHEDPIGAMLTRLAGSEADAPEGEGSDLVSLNRRPRRLHRSMYLWTSLAIALGATGLIAVGWKAWESASAAGAKAKDVLAATKKQVLEAAPPASNDAVMVATLESNPRKYIEDRVESRRRDRTKPSGLAKTRPILPELENLSLVLGNEGIELEEVRLSESLINVHVYVPETKVAEDIVDALGRLDRDYCDWKITYPTGTKNNLKLVWLDGTWKERSASERNGGTP